MPLSDFSFVAYDDLSVSFERFNRLVLRISECNQIARFSDVALYAMGLDWRDSILDLVESYNESVEAFNELETELAEVHPDAVGFDCVFDSSYAGAIVRAGRQAVALVAKATGYGDERGNDGLRERLDSAGLIEIAGYLKFAPEILPVLPSVQASLHHEIQAVARNRRLAGRAGVTEQRPDESVFEFRFLPDSRVSIKAFGESVVCDELKGFYGISLLLQCPGIPVPTTHLIGPAPAGVVGREAIALEYGEVATEFNGSFQESINVPRVRQQVESLKEMRDRAVANGQTTMADDLQESIMALEDQLKAESWNGKPKNLNKDKKDLQSAFRQRITRCKECIEQHSEPLAKKICDHIRACDGNAFIYEPAGDIVNWQVYDDRQRKRKRVAQQR